MKQRSQTPRFAAIAGLVAWLGLSGAVLADGATERLVGPDDRTGLALTIYGNDLALVKDQRKVTLNKGVNAVAFDAVAARAIPESAVIAAADNVTAIEQNFEFDLITPQSLLAKSVGSRMHLVRVHPATGIETYLPATVLSAEGGLVLQVGDRIETGVTDRLAFDALPPGLRARPTLVATLDSAVAGESEVELDYLSNGLSWRGEYAAELLADNRLALRVWATLTNTSGARFPEAAVKLVAGEVNRSRREAPRMLMMEARMDMAKAAPPMPAPEAVGAFHIYPLGRTVSLENNQTKQVALFSAPAVPVEEEYVSEGETYRHLQRMGPDAPPDHPEYRVLLVNAKAAGLGQPLPAGVARVYRRDSAGDLHFAGESPVPPTPTDDVLRLSLGSAFDLTVKRIQTDFSVVDAGENRRIYEASYRIDLRNAGARPASVKIVEPFPGEWTILDESAGHDKPASDRAQWMMPVAAKGSALLTYRVRVTQ